MSDKKSDKKQDWRQVVESLSFRDRLIIAGFIHRNRAKKAMRDHGGQKR